MHEFGIAQSIVEYTLSEAEKNKASRVSEIHLELGELTMIDRSILSNALKLLMTDPKLKGCKMYIRKKRVSFVCRKCSSEWSMAETMKQLNQVPEKLLVREPDSKELPLHFLPSLYSAFVRCPKCGSSDVDVTGGDDVRIRRLVLE
jgi:hydrogenase nickel insertion protein HypA